ncbi:MAG TPA: 2'-5' RNA ligase family protein [Flavobacteriales bacterium]|nr:2'-5' RNA ligase family protein [Flavobacteriales bacterium]
MDVWRYLLIIPPSPPVRQAVGRIKDQLAQCIGPYKNRQAQAHITLLFAYLPAVHERDLCHAITQGVKGHSPFPVRLHGFGHFPDRRSIHVEVQDPAPILRLRRDLLQHIRSYLRLKRLGIHATSAIRLIVAKLPPEKFGAAWAALEGTIDQVEQVDELHLLRGDQRTGTYTTVATFRL